MPAYLVVNYTVEDPALYGEYAAGAGPAMKMGQECELLAIDPKTHSLEGSPGPQTVILKFASKEKAKELYESGDYQAVIGKRWEATSGHFAVLVEGVPG